MLDRKRILEAEVASISQRQKRDKNGGSDYDVAATLVRCLQSQRLPEYQAAVAGPVDHYESQEADQKWGCGWRNIQMMASYLLRRDQASVDALFQGCGFVPDVLTLQAWLECAWKSGIDTAGGNLLGNKMQGSNQWIGATECAALLRLFGFKAQIVDFTGGLKSPNIQADKEGNDMHMGVECDHCHQCPIIGPRFSSQIVSDFDLCNTCHDLPECEALAPFRVIQKTSAPHGKAGSTKEPRVADKTQQNLPPHQLLMHWVWDHFSEGSGFDSTGSGPKDDAPESSSSAQPQHSSSAASSAQMAAPSDRIASQTPHQQSSVAAGSSAQQQAPSSSVFRSSNSPLYFQHAGHSRTIIGIERFRPQGSPKHTYNLLVLDPSIRSKSIEAKLKGGIGWQKLLKQGTHTLSKAQYQLLYVQSGLIQSGDRDKWSVMTAVETY